MKVKLEIKNDSKISIFFNEKEHKIDFKSDDKDIFKDLNKDIIENITTIDGIVWTRNQEESINYKIADKIANTFKEEINSIKGKLGLKNIEIEENEPKKT